MRRLLTVIGLAAAFGGGFALSHLLERDAHAQTSPLSSTVYIPSDGLVFRTFDGHVAARLSYGPHGGVFELFDEREQPSTALRGGAWPGGTAPAPPSDAPATWAPPGKRDLGI